MESQLEKKERELSLSHKKLDTANKKVVDLENQNSRFDDEIRFKDAMIQDLQAKLESTLEQLAILQLEAEHIREASQEDKQRLKARLEDLQEDLNVKRRPKQLHSVEWYSSVMPARPNPLRAATPASSKNCWATPLPEPQTLHSNPNKLAARASAQKPPRSSPSSKRPGPL